jgi:hypothetical protein
MKPSIKKAASRKTVRLATTFTGAAACAFAFVPAATAATGHPVTAGPGHQGGIRPDLGIDYSCPAGTEHWVHLALNNTKDYCVGGRGAHPFPLGKSPVIHGLCGGNNSGVITGSYVSNTRAAAFGHGNRHGFRPFGNAVISFGPGDKYRGISAFLVSSVDIFNYSGTDKCGLP